MVADRRQERGDGAERRADDERLRRQAEREGKRERDRREQHGGRGVRQDLRDECRGPVEREHDGERGPADGELLQLFGEKGRRAGLLHAEAERDDAGNHDVDPHVDLAVGLVDGDAAGQHQRDGAAEERHLRRKYAGGGGHDGRATIRSVRVANWRRRGFAENGTIIRKP